MFVFVLIPVCLLLLKLFKYGLYLDLLALSADDYRYGVADLALAYK